MLQRRLATDQMRRRALLRWSLLGATAAAVFRACPPAPRRFPGERAPAEPAVAVSRIEGGIVLEGGYLSQSGRAGIKLFFNEGSRFELTPGTRGRLRAVAEDGAHLAVENGTAALQVTQSRQRRWLVEAGPFLVTVKGTAFTVSWDPVERAVRAGAATRSGRGQRPARGRIHRVARRPPARRQLAGCADRDHRRAARARPPASPSTPAQRRPRCRRRRPRSRRTRPRDPPRRRPRSSSPLAKTGGARATGRPTWREDTGTASSRTSIVMGSTRRSRTRPAKTCSRSRTRPGIDDAPIWRARRCWPSGVVSRFAALARRDLLARPRGGAA